MKTSLYVCPFDEELRGTYSLYIFMSEFIDLVTLLSKNFLWQKFKVVMRGGGKIGRRKRARLQAHMLKQPPTDYEAEHDKERILNGYTEEYPLFFVYWVSYCSSVTAAT